jgi:hypothetical protein
MDAQERKYLRSIHFYVLSCQRFLLSILCGKLPAIGTSCTQQQINYPGVSHEKQLSDHRSRGNYFRLW